MASPVYSFGFQSSSSWLILASSCLFFSSNYGIKCRKVARALSLNTLSCAVLWCARQGHFTFLFLSASAEDVWGSSSAALAAATNASMCSEVIGETRHPVLSSGSRSCGGMYCGRGRGMKSRLRGACRSGETKSLNSLGGIELDGCPWLVTKSCYNVMNGLAWF